jgi:hypothetical protein
LVEGFEHDLDLFFKEGPVGVLVEHRRAKGLDLAGMVAAAHAEDDPPAGKDVGGRKVFGQSQGVPHGRDVEAAAKLDLGGHVGQMDEEHQQVGDALIPLPLEVMFRRPPGIIAQPVHQLGHGLALVEHRREVLVGEPAVVGWRPLQPDMVQVYIPSKEAAKFGNHSFSPFFSPWTSASSRSPGVLPPPSGGRVRPRARHTA